MLRLAPAGVSHPRTPVGYLCKYERGGGECLLAFDFGQVSHARTDGADAVQQV